MKPIKNVSINGLSFALEEDAYQIVDSYLKRLSDHYKGKENGAEIMESIEERLSELLSERRTENGTLSTSVIKDVIAILGQPEDIFSSSEREEKTYASSEPIKKKLYRDPDNKMLCGVFGGIGSYFNIDPTWLRILYVLLLILFSGVWNHSPFHTWNWDASLILLYFILAFCIPLAVTTRQKCELRGEKLSVDDIEKNIENRNENQSKRKHSTNSHSALMRIIGVIVGLFLVTIGAGGTIAFVVTGIAMCFTGLGLPFVPSTVISELSGLSTWVTGLSGILLCLAIFLPFVGMLYGGLALLFNFKSPRWRPGVVIFILWLLSCIGFVGISIPASSRFWFTDKKEKTSQIITPADTLHIEFEELDKLKDMNVIVKGDYDEFKMAYINMDKKADNRFAVFPTVKIRKFDEGTANIKASVDYFTKMSGRDDNNFYRFSNDTLFLSPLLIGKGKPVKEFEREVKISIPDSVFVTISKPVEHNFDVIQDYNDIPFPFGNLFD